MQHDISQSRLSAHLLLVLPVGLQLLQVPALVLGLQVLEAHGLQGLVQLLLVAAQDGLLGRLQRVDH